MNFPEPIKKLPLADIPLDGCTANLLQGENQQVLFMAFTKDVDLPEHSHEAQWGIVLSGNITMTIDGNTRTYRSGDNYYIPAGVKHSGTIYVGYSDITYFDQKDRYKPK